ncbi:MAG: hypothetical protein ACOC8D_01220 [bacterium]
MSGRGLRWARGLVAAALLAGAADCTVRHGDFTVVSNKMVRLSEFELGQAERLRRVRGTDVQRIIFVIPTSGQPTIEGAMDDAFAQTGGDVMTDAVIKQWGFYIPHIYGEAG